MSHSREIRSEYKSVYDNRHDRNVMELHAPTHQLLAGVIVYILLHSIRIYFQKEPCKSQRASPNFLLCASLFVCPSSLARRVYVGRALMFR